MKFSRRALLKLTSALPVVVTLAPSVARAQGSWSGQGATYHDPNDTSRSGSTDTPTPGTWQWRQEELERKLQEQRTLDLYGGFGER